jgi:hypothetical protein
MGTIEHVQIYRLPAELPALQYIQAVDEEVTVNGNSRLVVRVITNRALQPGQAVMIDSAGQIVPAVDTGSRSVPVGHVLNHTSQVDGNLVIEVEFTAPYGDARNRLVAVRGAQVAGSMPVSDAQLGIDRAREASAAAALSNTSPERAIQFQAAEISRLHERIQALELQIRQANQAVDTNSQLRDVMERDLATVREQLRIQEMRSAEQAAQFERAQHRIQELMLQLARTTQERDHARQQANELLADMQRQQGLMPDGR